jgi:hypothetical protein
MVAWTSMVVSNLSLSSTNNCFAWTYAMPEKATGRHPPGAVSPLAYPDASPIMRKEMAGYGGK